MEKCWGTNLDHLEDFLVRYPLVGTVYRTPGHNYTGPEHRGTINQSKTWLVSVVHIHGYRACSTIHVKPSKVKEIAPTTRSGQQ